MRASSDLPPRPGRRQRSGRSSHRGRIILVVVAVLLLVAFLSARGIARFYTDYLWFDSLGQSGVFTGVLKAKINLAAIFTTLFFVLLFVNLYIADKLAPTYRAPGPEEEFLSRYHELVAPRARLVRVGVSVLFAFIAGIGVSGEWRQWILFSHSRTFGVKDALFDADVSFYVFKLPFLTFLVSWLFASIVIILVVTAVAHYLNGGIRLQVSGERVTPQVKVHVSVLLGVLALLKAAGYWLQRYELLFSTRGAVNGATYTDVKAQLPAIYLLVIISVTSFVLLIYNVRRRGWVLPVLAVGLWALIALVAGAIYPAFIQRFQVQPAESTKERPYIDRNIKATQLAFNLSPSSVKTQAYPVNQTITGNDLQAVSDTLQNVRLVDPERVLDTYRQRQGVRGYYTFNQIDVDRYNIGGVTTPVAISSRELKLSAVPQQSWEGLHVAYTNGFGVAFAPANKVTSDGNPAFVDQSSSSSSPGLTQPNIYFGQNLDGYAVVGTNRAGGEVSLSPTLTDSTITYHGKGGVSMGSFVRRMAFALRFGEPNLLVSKLISGSSRILYIRDVRSRVEQLAPFLSFDAAAYPVVVNGRLLWVLDAYTTTDRYPYSQVANTDELDVNSGLRGKRFNYVRNSVKAVVDAYDGSASFYVTDKTDPLIGAYEAAFPNLFTSVDNAPAELKAHFRYPVDLFRIQTVVWGRYHVTTADDFYQRNDAWNVAQDPGSTQAGAGLATTQTTTSSGLIVQSTSKRRIDPYYSLMQLPGNAPTGQAFVLLRPFVPYSARDERQELVSFMTASGDPATYGQLNVYTVKVPDGDRPPAGPLQVQSNTQNDPVISKDLSLLDQTGSQVEFGTMQLLPIGDSVVWVRPLYVKPKGQSDLPVVRKVIVTFKNSSYMADTFEAALTLAFGSSPDLGTVVGATGTSPGGGGGGGGTGGGTTTTTPGSPTTTAPTATVQSLLLQASQLYTEANDALKAGNLALYQQKVDAAFAKVQQATQLGGGSTPTTTAPARPTTSTSTAGSGGSTTVGSSSTTAKG